ncbi:MAG: YdiU family protein [Bacteroidota bacterium]
MPTNIRKHSWYLENTYASLPAVFFSPQQPVPVAKPEMVCFNERLANDLGLGFLNHEKENSVGYLSGNKIPDEAEPLAQAYAGHQFGHFTMLGDGRAVLLGEQLDPTGKRFDIQLKGAGQTPYSRRGDGRATLYSMLREYLISESMYHLGIPTTRSLSVVSTGEPVYRGTMHNGAVLTRIADSHIRVGTFEYARNFCSKEDLQALTTYTIQRHYPEITDTDNPALELLKAVMQTQIDLIVNWMRVGFIHGVMNTDNMSIAGETIDYGPCAFMNSYDPDTVFSSIDTNGRYAFGNQSHVAQWNLAIFAGALLPVIGESQQKALDLAREVIEGFEDKFTEKWYGMMFGKLGILHAEDKDKDLVDGLLSLMKTNKSDYTQVFLALQQDKEPGESLFKVEEFKAWVAKWKNTHLGGERKVPGLALMHTLNPKVIPRNHWVENVLEAAVEGNLSSFTQLLGILSRPYDNHSDSLQFEKIPEGFDAGYQTFCGT